MAEIRNLNPWLRALPALMILVILTGHALAQDSAELQDALVGTGTVIFNDLEGGFYGLVSDDGKRYDPVNLEGNFRIPGLKVRFEARLLKDVAGFHMWGMPIRIIHIEALH